MSSTEKPYTHSPAVAYLSAAINAMPATIGDRVMSAALNDIMRIAIECRFRFDRTDGAVLANGRFGVHTCVGVFEPLSERFYYQACTAGGTYAAMWEKKHHFRPWMCTLAFTGLDLARNNRMAPGVRLYVPSSDDADTELQVNRLPGADLMCQVWLCTSISPENIVLCRYKTDQRGDVGARRPAKIWKLDRFEWDALQNRLESAAPATPAPVEAAAAAA